MNKQLLIAALAVFANYPDATEVLVCEDGNVFLPERRNLAENHCREAKLPAPKELTRERAEAWKDTLDKGQQIVDDAKARTKEDKAAAAAAAKEAEEKAAAEAAAAKEAEEKAAAEAAKEAEEKAAAEAAAQNGNGAQATGTNKGGKKGAGN